MEAVNGVPRSVLAAVARIAREQRTDMNSLPAVLVKITDKTAKEWLRQGGEFAYRKVWESMDDYAEEISNNTFAV